MSRHIHLKPVTFRGLLDLLARKKKSPREALQKGTSIGHCAVAVAEGDAVADPRGEEEGKRKKEEEEVRLLAKAGAPLPCKTS